MADVVASDVARDKALQFDAADSGQHDVATGCKVPIAFSLATFWGVTIKTSLGRPGFSVDPARLQSALLAEGFIELGIKATHVLRVATLPWVHRDPFDRWLVAQASEEGLTLLTADTTLKRYGRVVELV